MESVFLESSLFEVFREKNSIEAEVVEIEKNIMIVESEYGFIVIMNDKNYIGPMSIAVEQVSNFKEYGIRIGDEFVLTVDSIKISNKFVIEISKLETIDLRLQLEGHSQDGDGLNKERIRRNLFKMEDQLYVLGKRSGMLPILFNIGDYISELESCTGLKMYNNMYTSLIFTRVLSLFEKLIQGRLERAEHCVRDIISFGTVNNNYSNGFLLGILSAFIYGGKAYGLKEEGLIELNEMLIKGVSIDTENLYHNMLLESIDGGSPKVIPKAINSIIFCDDDEILENSIEELLKIDSISGTDALCGIYMGLRVLQKEKFREAIKNL